MHFFGSHMERPWMNMRMHLCDSRMSLVYWNCVRSLPMLTMCMLVYSSCLICASRIQSIHGVRLAYYFHLGA